MYYGYECTHDIDINICVRGLFSLVPWVPSAPRNINYGLLAYTKNPVQIAWDAPMHFALDWGLSPNPGRALPLAGTTTFAPRSS